MDKQEATVDLLLQISPDGLYCKRGNFHIDPWNPVPRAVITHAHSDHARRGSAHYLSVTDGVSLLRARLGDDIDISALDYGNSVQMDGVNVSFHPAGHVLGSAQIRVEYGGEVWVASGDYKTAHDRTCAPFEPIRCNTFITESTFGLPIYRWNAPQELFESVNHWWRANQELGRASVLFAYSLGKAQRLIAGVDPAIGPIFCHGAVQNLNVIYRESGVPLPETLYTGSVDKAYDWSKALIIAPPGAQGSTWMRKFGPASSAFASGWMRLRGTRRRQSLDRGFVLSDHADWPGLLDAISATGAERVLVTHGYRAQLARWLIDNGRDAQALETRFEGETAAEDVTSEDVATEPGAAE
jgi:putative mRNA 3-end processing factor